MTAFASLPATSGAYSQGPAVPKTIKVSQLNHYFGEGELRKQALHQNNLEVKRGEIVIMTGPSGSGKTTLLTLIAIPTFYEILDEWRSGLARRFGMRVKQQTAEYPVPGLAPEAGD